MFTISDILQDISRGCAANNLNEDCFSYRIVFFVNEENTSKKYCVNSSYGDLRQTLESIVRGNLSLENNLVFAQTTVLRDRKCVCLQSRSYGFSLEGYFCQIYGKGKKRNNACNKYASALCGN